MEFKSYDHTEIPNEPGIYAFRAVIATPACVGLIGNSGFDVDSLSTARKKILERLLEIDHWLSERQMTGKAMEHEKAQHLAKILHLQIEEKITLEEKELSKRLDKVDDQNIFQLVKLLNLVTLALPPLYVGITVDQTLSARYKQHRLDFETKRAGSFGGRITQTGIRWTDLDFSAICLSTSMMDSNNMRFAEYILHSLGKPLYSHS